MVIVREVTLRCFGCAKERQSEYIGPKMLKMELPAKRRRCVWMW